MNEYEELKTRFERLRALYNVANVIHSTLDPQEALRLIVREAVRLVNAASGSVALLNPNTGFLEILAAHGLPEGVSGLRLRPGEGITGWVVGAGKAARVGDVRQDPRYIPLRPNVHAELAVPLEVNGEVRGVLNVDSDRAEAFSEADEETLCGLALQASRVIQNTWLAEQLRLKARLFETLAGVSQAINSTVNLDDALEVITREASVLMRAKMCSLMLLDASGDWLDLRASYGAGEAYLRKPRLSVHDSLLGVVVRRKKPVHVENVQTSSQYQNVETARQEGLAGLLSVPLILAPQNDAIGVLTVYTVMPYTFSNEEVRILSAFAELSALAIHKARLYERVVDVEEQMRRNEKLTALGLLAAEVAHEIRNPLTVMKMLYHSLDLRFEASDPRSRDAALISEKIDQLNRIVERILDFARTTEPALSPLNLNEVIEEVCLLVRHKLKQQNVAVERNLDPALPCVMADSGQLAQAFLNIILNAAEAMPNGGKLSLISRGDLGSATEPAHVVIEFKDTGSGMTGEQRRSAFKTVLATTKRHGTGLGLAIVARVLEAHEGQVSIKSRPGQGTVVRIVLPAISAI